MDAAAMNAVVARIEADLANVTAWGEVDDKGIAATGHVGYGGAGKHWQFLLAAKGDNCAGTAVRLPLRRPGVPSNDPNIVKLPYELAKKAVSAARKALGGKA